MVITLSDYTAGTGNFSQSYFLANCDAGFSGQEQEIPWDSFQTEINNFITNNHCAPDTVALRFVYCYDKNQSALYLRMQILTMTPVTPNTYNLNPNPCAWYIIQNGAISSTQDTSLFDQNYLNNFYYCPTLGNCVPSQLQPLSSDQAGTMYARNVTFPWMIEVSQMYLDNGSPQGAYLCFAASAGGSPCPAPSPIAYPHTLILYLKDKNGVALLNNQPAGMTFTSKGCDMGTICPICCNVYMLPL